ncbi:MAG: O-antigen ligase domain-containing protein [Phycisphaerae bacterium]|jgi:hypothetical protein
MQFSLTAGIALFGLIPVALLLGALLPIRKALAIILIGGWLLLPNRMGLSIPGFLDYTKITAVSTSLMLVGLAFGIGDLLRYRWSWCDLPVAALCLVPIGSALSNDLGIYEGLSGAAQQVLTWGIPYLFGRVYFNDVKACRILAVGIVIGGLAYVPLCLFEMRMSPQLHRLLYGIHAERFSTAYRLGGYRPMVFLSHGIELGLFMACASLAACWLWRTRSVPKVLNLTIGWAALVILGTTVLCRSLGALVLLLTLLGALGLLWRWRTSPALVLFMVAPLLYVGLRLSNVVELEGAAALFSGIDKERADSLKARFEGEEALIASTWQRPWLGWCGSGRGREYNEEGRAVTAVDGLWIVTFGQNGFLGLIPLMLALSLPGLLLYQRLGARGWLRPEYAPVTVLAMVTALYAMDCTMNAMQNLIYHLALGSVTTFALRVGAREEGRTAWADGGLAGKRPAPPVTRAPARACAISSGVFTE